MVRELQELGVVMTSSRETDAARSTVLAGKTFVVTGTLIRYKRNEVKELIEQHGGRAASSVSSKTDYLLAGEQAGSKLTRAQELGVTIIGEDQFAEILSGNTS